MEATVWPRHPVPPGLVASPSSPAYICRDSLTVGVPLSELRQTLEQALGTTYRLERELGGGGMSRGLAIRRLGPSPYRKPVIIRQPGQLCEPPGDREQSL